MRAFGPVGMLLGAFGKIGDAFWLKFVSTVGRPVKALGPEGIFGDAFGTGARCSCVSNGLAEGIVLDMLRRTPCCGGGFARSAFGPLGATLRGSLTSALGPVGTLGGPETGEVAVSFAFSLVDFVFVATALGREAASPRNALSEP